MKLLFYDDFKLGAMSGNTVVDLSDAVDEPGVTPPVQAPIMTAKATNTTMTRVMFIIPSGRDYYLL